MVAVTTALQVCDAGLLSYCLVATSSLHECTRAAAYCCLQALLLLLTEETHDTDASFRVRPQVLLQPLELYFVTSVYLTYALLTRVDFVAELKLTY
jgi:hypothetical protein